MTVRNKSKGIDIFHCIVVFFLMFVFGHIMPPIGNITSLGMQIVGVFLGLLYGWTFVSFLWPSLLSFLAIGLTDAMSVGEALASGFGANLTLSLIFIFIFAKYLEESGLNQYIAYWFISRKIAVGRPWILALMILACSFVLGVTTNLFASIVVCWSVFYEISDALNLQKRSKFVAVMLLGVCVAATFGSMAVPFQAVPLASIGIYEQVTGEAVKFISYSGFCIAMSLVLIVVYLLVGKYIFRADVSKIALEGDVFARYRGKKMETETKTSAIVLVVFLILIFLPNVLPSSWEITKIFANFGLLGDLIAVLIALLIIKTNNGDSVIDFGRCAAYGINWEIVILIACTMPVCNALESDEAGVLDAFLEWAVPIMNNLSSYGVLVFVVIAVLIMTQIAHNMVLCIIFVPLMAPIVAQFGINPIAALIAIIFAAHVAYMTPAASTQVAMVYSNVEWVDKKHIYQLAFLYVPIVALFYVLILVPCLMKLF